RGRYRSAYPLDLGKIEEIRRKFVQRFEGLYQVFSRPDATGRERMTELLRFLILHGTETYLEEKSQELLESEPVRAREYAQLWRILLEIFDRIVGLLGEDAMTLQEFGEILQTGIDEAKVGLVPPGLDQIMVGDMERTRLNGVRCLFFLGLNEGIVPKPQAGGGVLSEQDRMLFEENGIELAPNRRQNAFLSEFYLYLSLTKPLERLYLSYRRSEGSGKAMRPSYLLSRVQKLFPKIRVEMEDDLLKVMGNVGVLGTDRGFSWFLRGVREYAAGGEVPELFAELYTLYRTGEFAAPLPFASVASAAFYKKPEEALSVENAKKLYGETLYGSVTRLEQYAACAFAHFLVFGLNVEERVEYQIGMPDIGTVYHNALQYYSAGVKESGYDWHTIPEKESDELLMDAVKRAAQEYGEGIFASSGRSRELVNRIARMLRRTVNTVQIQIRRGDFEPEEFEYDFTHADRYLALRGRIDRIDLYHNGREDYVRVVDYKSGNVQFKLEKLYYGLSLQLAVYMEAAMQWAKEKGMERAVPAGMLYYHIDDPIVDKGGDPEVQIQKKLVMNGLVNAKEEALVAQDNSFYDAQGGLAAGVSSNVIPASTGKSGNLSASSMAVDGEYFGKVLSLARERLFENAKKILSGDVEPAPYRRGLENACDFCTLKDACNFDRRLSGYHYRDLKKLAKDEVREKICGGEASVAEGREAYSVEKETSKKHGDAVQGKGSMGKGE
ncbi:MAG: PD-(D/E)XK nuclease family protein, partial [Lachnospiraceae bacterium]|nr:PD-(D/E)XK nuclease family protein [Lachnospiraceae bacterium]